MRPFISNRRSLVSGPPHQLLPGPAAPHALRPLSHNVRTWARILVAGLDQDPTRLPGLRECEAARKLPAMQDERQMPRLVAHRLGGPLIPQDNRAGAAFLPVVDTL